MSETRFGDYRVTGSVGGGGGQSSIFRAVQEPLGRVVAVKTLKTEIAATSSFGEQLDREAKILADLVHHNVVLLLDANRTAAGRPYVVLEWVDGPSLQEVLAKANAPATGRSREKPTRRPKISVAAALAIAHGIASALEHVHERGIVHRNVKPSNVLLSRAGHVKLIDFGIAQRPRTLSMSDTLGTEGITASGRMAPEQVKDAFGTPAYMSPEQILGDFVDGRSDLFSLGVVLYQLLGGTRPFETAGGDDPKRGAAQRIRRDAPAPLRERAPHCPRSVERIVMRLLEKSPDDRYPSAGSVKERLETALRAETREDPSVLVRRELVVFGFAPKDEATSRADIAPKAVERSRSTARRALGLPRAVMGFAVVTALFLASAIVNEASNPRAREARAAGSQPLELAPDRAGGLRVVATPWAFVRVDGQLVETTPFARAIPLGPGKHFVTLTHPDSAPVEREITVVTGETLTLDVTMSPGPEDAGKDAR